MSAVVLLSGGIDSAVALAEAVEQGGKVCALTVDYGQRNPSELHAAAEIAEFYGEVDHQVVTVGLRSIVDVGLTGDAPIYTLDEERRTSLSPAYVPARNTILLSLGLAAAEQCGADEVIIGVSASDAHEFPDCRPAYITAWQSLAALACGTVKRIVTPHLLRTKVEVIQAGASLPTPVPFGLTVSCYNAQHYYLHCGRCDSCELRRESFAASGVADPTMYVGSEGASRHQENLAGIHGAGAQAWAKKQGSS